jgi:hypothetical protein
MAVTQLIAARVSPETKARFRMIAEQQLVTESVLLKRLIQSMVGGLRDSDADILQSPHRRLRGARLAVRLHPEDQLLLTLRARARQMAPATYVSVLVRVHLRTVSPLPEPELMALKRSVAELGAIGRNINQLARYAHQTTDVSGVTRQQLMSILKACEALRHHTKDLIKANAHSWETGHANDPP